MKNLFIVVLLSPFFSLGQDCKLKKETDDFSHETRISTGFVPFNGGINQVLLSIDANSKEVDFFFSLGSGVTCFDNSSTATILFEGSKVKATYRNTGTMNCKGLFHITFRNLATTPFPLQKLASQKVSTIRLTGNSKVITDINLKDEEKELLINMATCLVKEAKTLIKQP